MANKAKQNVVYIGSHITQHDNDGKVFELALTTNRSEVFFLGKIDRGCLEELAHEVDRMYKEMEEGKVS